MKRNRWMLAAAVLLFLLVLGVSRVADFGILPDEQLAATAAERNKVKVELSIVATTGQRRPIGAEPSLAAGERLELSYGPTRYPYVWVVAVDPEGRARPLVEGKLTAPRGETLTLEPEEERFRLLCFFSAVPRTFEQIQTALDRDIQLPGLRFAWRIDS